MSGMQNAQMGGTWHSTYSITDRQKVIQILASTLKDINGNFDEQKAASMAQEFEKYTFVKSQSREEYLRLIKQKVTQLRSGLRSQPAAAQVPASDPMNNQQMSFFPQGRQQPQMQRNTVSQQPQQPQQQNQPMNHNQAQMGAPQSQSGQSFQPTQQQIQQISSMIRTVPIPPTLLSKVPNLPPNVNTWTQIYDCFQKKIIPSSAMPVIKEIHNAHFQLALRQHQQQKMAQFRRMSNNMASDASNGSNQNQSMMGQNFNMNSVNSDSMKSSNGSGSNNMNLNGMNMNMGANNVNMNNMNNMSNMNMNNMGNMNNVNMNHMGNVNNANMNLNMGVNRSVQGNNMNMSTPQMNQGNGFRDRPQSSQQDSQFPVDMQKQQTSMNQMNKQPQNQAVGGANGATPNVQITAQDLAKYSADAMTLLNRLQQNGSIQPNLDQAQKQNFIRKYIYHQKLNALKMQGKAQMNAPQGVNQQNQQPNRSPVQTMSIPAQQQQQQQHIPASTGPQSLPMQSPNLQQMQQPNLNPMMGQVSNNGNNQQTFSPAVQQRPMPAQAPNTQGSIPNANQNRQNAALASAMPVLTDEMKMKLRALFEEVSRNGVQLKDVTMMLSEKDKAQVKEAMVRITQQYQNVDSILSYFYVLTRNIEGTKRLIQMKNMTKNILENLQRGIYLAGPDLLEKMRSQYQKHFDYVKEQLQFRRMQQTRSQSQGQNQLMQPGNQRVGQAPPLPQAQQPFAQQSVPMQTQPPQQFNGADITGNMARQQQQFVRNNTSGQVAPPMTMPNMAAGQRIGSSPAMPNSTPPNSQGFPKQGKPQPEKKRAPVNRRKSVKPNSAMPTPAASAPTPATLANAIKTPNSISTPQLATGQSNKGTPNGASPPTDQKVNGADTAPLSGEVFGSHGHDTELVKRRELSNSDPEAFFFSALSNLLELPKSESEINDATKDSKTFLQSPLSPSSSYKWTASIKPYSIISSFQQVGALDELSSSSVLEECGELVEREYVNTQDNKREREIDDDDMDFLFEDKKSKLDFDELEKTKFTPVEFDEWKTWLNGLQQPQES